MISIWYFNIKNVHQALFDQLLQTVPVTVQQSIQTLRFFKDQQLKLFGRLLVEQFHKTKNIPFDWSNWRTNTQGKPYMLNGSSFNISHSGNLVAVAFASQNVGLDLERIEERNIDPIIDHFHALEKRHIDWSHNKKEAFYHIWTRKEAFIKAKGTGLLNALHEDNSLSNELYYNNKSWFLHSLSPLAGYQFAVCSLVKNSPIQIKEIGLSQLFVNQTRAA